MNLFNKQTKKMPLMLHSQFKIRFSLFLLFFSFVFSSFAQSEKEITLEDIWLKGTFQPNYLYAVNWMKDGSFYTALDFDRASRTLNVTEFDVKTGNPVKVLVQGSILSDPATGIPFLLDNYTLSPDESQVLLASGEEPIYRRSSKAFFYIYDLPSQKLLKIADTKILAPAYSPDGKKIAYVKDNNLFVFDIKSGKTQQITKDGAINKTIYGKTDWVYEEEFEFFRAFFWSPDSKRLAFYRFDESQVKEYTLQLWGDSLYPQSYSYKYPKAGEKNSEVRIWVYELESGKSTAINTGEEKDQYIPRVQWTEDPVVLSIQRLNRHQNHFEILHANIATGTVKKVYDEKNDTYIEISDNLIYLKDKKHFILLSEKDGFRHIYKYDIDGKKEQQLTSGKWVVQEINEVDDANQRIYFTSTEASAVEKQLYAVSFDGKKEKRISLEKGYHDVNISPDAAFYIDYFSTASVPYKISVHALPSGKELKLLIDNSRLESQLDTYAMSKPEFFTFKTSENVDLNAFIIKPPHFDPAKKYPVLLSVYGGPGIQTVLDQWMGSNYLWYQLLAEKGYIIVSVDNRGTGGRGAAFKKCTQNQLGKLETQDMVETARYLKALSYVDTNRIGIFGWSFGGYLSSLAMTRGAGSFHLGIAVAPVTSWRFYDTIYTERFLGLPQENPEGYDANSPLSYAAKLEGKFLLIHGTADDNVHLQNSMELESALIEAGKQFDVFYYPDKNHSIYGGNTRYHLYTLMTDYILKNL